jgi:hypothetical protein
MAASYCRDRLDDTPDTDAVGESIFQALVFAFSPLCHEMERVQGVRI